jgi:hypothetical protein
VRFRPSGSIFVSIAIHIVVGAALVYILSLPYPLRELMRRDKASAVAVERIGFIALPEQGESRSGRSGGDGRPTSTPTPEPPDIVAPSVVPEGVPEPPAERPRTEGGAGPVVGRGGPARGIVPSYSDPRLWTGPSARVVAPKSASDRLDSVIVAEVESHLDSVNANTPRRRPTDWTFERGGKKYGLDENKIYLGDFSIPSAVLALLPLNTQANPTAYERERALNAMHRDIQYHAQRAMNDDEFRERVKRIRERKERERREAEAKQVAEDGDGRPE